MRQDLSNRPLQQDGMHRPGFEYMLLARKVQGRISSLHRTIDAYLLGLPHDVTAKVAFALNASHGDAIIDFEYGW